MNLVVKLIEVEIDAEDLERWIGEFKGRAKLKKHRCNEHDHEDDDETVVVHSDLAVQEANQAIDDDEVDNGGHPTHAVSPEAVETWFSFFIDARFF